MSEEFVANAMKAVPDAVAKSTVAIVVGANKAVSHLGSGFLLAIADARFVVTAAHVLDGGYPRTVGVTARPPAFVATSGEWMRSTGGAPNAHDFQDVAVYRLSDAQIERFDAASFLRLTEFCFEETLTDGYFLLSGFPGLWATTADQSNKTLSFRMLQYGGPAYNGDVVGLEAYDCAEHLLIEAREEGSFGPGGSEMDMRTRSGIRANFPGDLKGASGCGVWQIGSLTKSPETWAAADAKVVGFFTATYKRRQLIRATRCRAVTMLIGQAYPDLRDAIRLYA